MHEGGEARVAEREAWVLFASNAMSAGLNFFAVLAGLDFIAVLSAIWRGASASAALHHAGAGRGRKGGVREDGDVEAFVCPGDAVWVVLRTMVSGRTREGKEAWRYVGKTNTKAERKKRRKQIQKQKSRNKEE